MRLPRFRFTVLSLLVLIAVSGGIFYELEMERRSRVSIILAHTYRGPKASNYAESLASELRDSHGFSSRVQEVIGPGSMPQFVVIVEVAISEPEAKALCLRVKKIAPQAPLSLSSRQKTLDRAILTTNSILTAAQSSVKDRP